GFCAPAAPLYDFAGIAVADRPVRDALARVTSARGRVTFVPPAQLSDVAPGTTVHTLQNDIDAVTKPVVTIACATPVTVAVDGVPLRVKVGNFDKLSFPEHFMNWWETALAAHARVADRNLLDRIDTNSAALTDTSLLGA